MNPNRMNPRRTPPFFAGGQGRTGRDVRDAGTTQWYLFALFAVLVLGWVAYSYCHLEAPK
jgi:hypothetical protein